MNHYNTVIFDLGMTLIYPPMVDSFFNRLRELGGAADKKEIAAALNYVDKHLMINYPGYLNREVNEFYTSYASLVFTYLHITDISVKDFSAAMMEKSPPRSEWRIFSDAIPCLEKLKKMGCSLGLLTNWDLSARDLLKTVGLYHYFDSIVVSAEIKSEKPSAKGFLKSLMNLESKPEKTLYVGDNYHDDVIGANGVGVKALLIERDGHYKYKAGNYERIKDLTEVCNFCSG